MARISQEDLYAPCTCGSGKKLKFCCYGKLRERSPERSPEEDRVEKALLLVESGAIADGRAILEDLRQKGSRNLRALNTLAVVRFRDRDVDDAIALADHVFREVAPGHAYSGGLLAHALAALGRTEEAHEVADRLVRAPLLDESHGHMAVCALGALGRDADVVAVAERTPEPRSGVVTFARGMALLNLGRTADAARALRQVTGELAEVGWLRRAVASLERGVVPVTPWGRYPLLPLTAWLPGDAVSWISKAASDDEAAAVARRFPLLVEMMKQLVLVSEDREGAAGALALLAKTRLDAAKEALLALAEGRWGSDDDRLAAARLLVAEGLVPADHVFRMRLRGQVSDVTLAETPAPAPADVAAAAAAGAATAAVEEKDAAPTVAVAEEQAAAAEEQAAAAEEQAAPVDVEPGVDGPGTVEAAATLWRLAPWDLLPEGRRVFRVRMDPSFFDPGFEATVSVVGGAGVGVGGEAGPGVVVVEGGGEIALRFEDKAGLSAARLAEIERHGWPTVDERVPVVVGPAARRERLEVCTRAVCAFLEKGKKGVAAWDKKPPKPAVVAVPSGGGELKLRVEVG